MYLSLERRYPYIPVIIRYEGIYTLEAIFVRTVRMKVRIMNIQMKVFMKGIFFPPVLAPLLCGFSDLQEGGRRRTSIRDGWELRLPMDSATKATSMGDALQEARVRNTRRQKKRYSENTASQ